MFGIGSQELMVILIDCFFYLWCKAPAGVGE